MADDRPGQLILKRRYFDEFASGIKTIEYRRHRGQFTARNFRIGRRFRLAYSYSWRQQGMPHLDAIVRSFEARPACGPLLADMRGTYPDLGEGEEVALIGLNVVRR